MNFHLFPARIIPSINIIGYSFHIASTLFSSYLSLFNVILMVVTTIFFMEMFKQFEISLLLGKESAWKWYLWIIWRIKHLNNLSRRFLRGGDVYKDLSTDFIIKSKSFTTLTHNQWVISAFARLPSHGIKWF